MSAYYVLDGDAQKGPFSQTQIASMAEQGWLSAGARYFDDAAQEWRPLDELFGQAPGAAPAVTVSESWRSKYVEHVKSPNSLFRPTKKLRVLAMRCYLPVVLWKAKTARYRRGNTSAKVGRAEIIGPAPLVEQAREALQDIHTSLPELHDALVGAAAIVICLVPSEKMSRRYANVFHVADDYLCWGKPGLFANLAWAAFLVKWKLHRPEVLVADWYNQRNLLKTAAIQTSRWLETQNQPSELVRYFASRYSSPEEAMGAH